MIKEDEPILSYRKLQQLTGEDFVHPGEYRILLVDDNIYDAELTLRELKRQNQVNFISKIVTDKFSYVTALHDFQPDIVYCDFNISPDFNAVSAIKILKKDFPDVPFILVTGTLNEEVASICVYEGIDDYVLKSNLSRIQLSLLNAVKIRRIELQKKEVYEKLVRSEREVRSFAKHLNKVLEDERSRLAREIHDELGQQLAGIKLGISSLRINPPGIDAFGESIKGLLQDIDITIQNLRKIATELRPGILDTLGLAASIHWLVNEFTKKSDTICHFETNVKNEHFPQRISTCYFRISQEALTNVSKHAGASRTDIELLRVGENLKLLVRDNGIGITPGKLTNPFSMGLLGVRERVKELGGTLNLECESGNGTCITVLCPIL